MTIRVYIDHNIWDFLYDHNIKIYISLSHFINTNLDVDFDTLVACYCSSEFFSKKSH